MGTEIVKTRFQHICEASKDQFSLVLSEQMHDITLTKLCEQPANYMSISGLAKTDRSKLNVVIQKMIGEVCQAINIGQTLTVPQIQILASHIISDFGFMSLEAVYLCFKGIILGHGKEAYGLDIPFFCKRLSEFDNEWYAQFSRIRDSKHGQDKGSMKTQFTDAAVTLYRKHERDNFQG